MSQLTARKTLRVRLLYRRAFVWFYIWKWTMSIPWLHRRTIRGVNLTRLDYLEALRADRDARG